MPATASGDVPSDWSVQPFSLDQVSVGEGVFQQKRDRMLNYLRNYGSETDPLAGPDRMLSIFRANAGLDTKGAEPPGSWESENGYLRGPSGADFDLYLYKWNGYGWSQVASATSSDSNEDINYSGTSGYYYWEVYSYSGSGSFDFYLE